MHYQWASHYIHADIRGSGVPEAQTEDRNATSTTVRRTPTYGSRRKRSSTSSAATLPQTKLESRSIYNMFKSYSEKKTASYHNFLEEAESPQYHVQIGTVPESDSAIESLPHRRSSPTPAHRIVVFKQDGSINHRPVYQRTKHIQGLFKL